MAKVFDPLRVLKQVSIELLRKFFAGRGELQDLPWDDLREIGPIYDAWQRLPEAQLEEVQVVLQDLDELAEERALGVLAEEIQWRCPDRMAEFVAVPGRVEKAMWVFIEVPDAFREASLFARADALETGRYWVRRNSLPHLQLTVDDKLKARLADALVGFYGPKQGRGRHCHIEHYRRANSAEYFFAYLDDYPDRHPLFDDSGNFRPERQRYAFQNIFVYCPNDGTLELFARGGRKVYEPLQELFGKAVLDVEVGPMRPNQAAYRLDGLKNAGFPLPTEPGDRINEVRVHKLRLEPIGVGRRRITLEADPNANRNDIHDMLNRYLNVANLPPEGVRVTQATFQLKFQHEGKGRAKRLTFDVSYPNSSNLKSKPDLMRAIGERCLKLWGITGD